MSTLDLRRTQKYIAARQQHPAWLLLVSRRAPLTLSCLEALFEHQRDGVAFDAAVQALADLLGAHANQPEYDIDAADLPAQARRELREWIRRGLVTEREGGIHETDALKSALRQAILSTRQHCGGGGRTRCLAATQTRRSSGRLQPAGRRRRRAGVRQAAVLGWLAAPWLRERLEQEFLPPALVAAAVRRWHQGLDD